MSEQRPAKRRGIQEQKLDSELMLHDPDNGNVHILNETSKTVWRLVDGRRTLNQIEMDMRKLFSVDEGQDIKNDIENVINELSEKGLLVEVGDQETAVS